MLIRHLLVCTVARNEGGQDPSSIERDLSQAALGNRQAVLGFCGERVMHQGLLYLFVDWHLRQQGKQMTAGMVVHWCDTCAGDMTQDITHQFSCDT